MFDRCFFEHAVAKVEDMCPGRLPAAVEKLLPLVGESHRAQPVEPPDRGFLEQRNRDRFVATPHPAGFANQHRRRCGESPRSSGSSSGLPVAKLITGT